MFIIEILVNFIEASLVYALLRSALPLPKKEWYQYTGILIVTAVVSILNYVSLDYTLQIILVVSLHIAYAFACFSGSPMEKILWGSSYMVIASVAERIAFKIGILFQVEDLSIFLVSGLERYALISIYLFIGIIVVWLLTRINNAKIDLPFSYQVLLIFFIWCSLSASDLLSDIMILAQKEGNVELIYYTDIVFVMLLFMAASLVYLVRKISQIYSERNTLALEHKNAEYLQKEYLSYKHMMENMRALKHDYSNHLQVLNNMVQNIELQKARNYVDELQKSIHIENGNCNSGNEILDVIISAKAAEARKKGIEMEFSVILLKPLPLNEVEVTSLFANLLDNAIEANYHVGEKRRFIKIVVKPYREDISIVIKNRYDGTLKRNENGLLSKKEYGDHGIGLKQVKRIVDASGGYFTWKTEDDIFIATVILPTHRE